MHPYFEPEAFGLVGRPFYYSSEPVIPYNDEYSFWQDGFYHDGPSFDDYNGFESIGTFFYRPNVIDGFDYETNSFIDDSKLVKSIVDSPKVVDSSMPIQLNTIVAQNHIFDGSSPFENDTVMTDDGTFEIVGPQNEFQTQTEENSEPNSEDSLRIESLNTKSSLTDDSQRLPVHRNMDNDLLMNLTPVLSTKETFTPLVTNTASSSQPERIMLSVPNDMKVSVITSSLDISNNEKKSSEQGIFVKLPSNFQVKVVPEQEKLNAAILSKK